MINMHHFIVALDLLMVKSREMLEASELMDMGHWIVRYVDDLLEIHEGKEA